MQKKTWQTPFFIFLCARLFLNYDMNGMDIMDIMDGMDIMDKMVWTLETKWYGHYGPMVWMDADMVISEPSTY